jgi:hypothetical protein
VKKACEPLHAQMNLPDYALAVVNTTRNAAIGLTLRTRVLSLANVLLAERRDHLDAPANQTTTLAPLPLPASLARESVVLVILKLSDSRGQVLSENSYWQGASEASLQQLNRLSAQPVRLTSRAGREGGESLVRVTLTNQGLAPVLAAKLTLLDQQGRRILPAYYSDNYLTLLPGERHEVTIRYDGPGQATQVALRGWNVQPGGAVSTPGP